MAIDSIYNATAQTTATTETTRTDELGQADFLNLLITQLKSQDPLNPMDSTEFTAQLAQFNSLEQLISINTRLDTLAQAQSEASRIQSMDLIGKTVRASMNTVQLEDGDGELRFELAEDAASVHAAIYDASGAYVRTIASGSMTAGEQTLAWDGRDRSGNAVPDGIYRFELVAMGEDDAPVEATAYTECAVTGVSFETGSAMLLSDGVSLPLASVLRVMSEDG
jgi:flagellar basal-body rod modification protein FlgD